MSYDPVPIPKPRYRIIFNDGNVSLEPINWIAKILHTKSREIKNHGDPNFRKTV